MDYAEYMVRRSITTAYLIELETAAFGKQIKDPEFKKFQSKWTKFQGKIIVR